MVSPKRNLALLNLLWSKNIKQKDLAKGAGITVQTVSSLVNQNHIPSKHTAEQVARFLECEISEIFECVYSKKLHKENL